MLLVVTPAHKEDDEVILNNILSVQKQKVKCVIFHYLIFDGLRRKYKILEKVSKFNNVFIYETRNNHDDYGDYVVELQLK